MATDFCVEMLEILKVEGRNMKFIENWEKLHASLERMPRFLRKILFCTWILIAIFPGLHAAPENSSAAKARGEAD